MSFSNRFHGLWLVFAAVAVTGCSSGSGGDADAVDVSGNDDVAGETVQGWSIEWVDQASMPTEVAVAAVVESKVRVLHDGVPESGVTVGFQVVAGGGSVANSQVMTDESGIAATDWQVGIAAVPGRIEASITQSPSFVDHVVVVIPGDPAVPQAFGDIDTLLTGAGIDGSTEGLVFDDAGNLFLAVPGNLIRMSADGTAELVAASGDGLEAPLGMAWDYLRKVIWVADKGALKKVTSAGVATTVATTDGTDPLVTPNSVAIRENRWVYATDSCTGRVFRVDVDQGTVETVAVFDIFNQGGPNGLAFDDTGKLWVTTENIGLLCTSTGADPMVVNGGLYSLDVSGGLPAVPTPRLESFAMFGDGLAFDRDGNLYVIFDRFDGFTLVDSAVWLVPADGEPYKVVSASDRLIANMAWGNGNFGENELYFSLLAVSLVSSFRGAMKAPAGIPGRPLAPADLPD